MTRVLHVIHGLRRGGLENGVINLLNRLPDDIVQGVVCLDVRGEMADRIDRPVDIWVLDRGRHDLKVPIRLAGIIRDWKPDVIHARNWNAWADALAGHVLAGRSGKLVWSFHGFPDGQEAMPAKRRWASRQLARFTHGLFAVCRDAAERYAGVSGVPVERFDVLYNGVDTGRFQPSETRSALRESLGLPPDELVFVVVASLTPVKDHAGLLSALGRIGAQQLVTSDGRRVSIWFVGEGALRPELEARCQQLGLDERVHLPGASDRVADYLAAADGFILPSRLEGMSNAIIEAMAAGLPVIARRVGGNPELVMEAETGLLSEPGSAESLEAGIRDLIADPKRMALMGQAGRDRAQQLFSIDAMMKNYADYYRRMGRS